MTKSEPILLFPEIVAAMKPGTELADAMHPGLRVRCSADGKKRTFYLRYRDSAGALRQYTLGAFGPLTLAKARAQVEAWRVKRRAGEDPQADLRARAAKAKAEREKAKPYRFGELVAHYLEEHIDPNRKPKGAGEVRRMLTKAVAAYGAKAAQDFARSEAHELIRTVAERAPRLAQMVRLELRAAWEHAAQAGRVAHENPFAGRRLGAIPKREPKQRALSVDDVGALLRWWRQPGAHSRTVRDALELVLRTGLRSGEVCALHTSELEFRAGVLWAIIPGARMKMGAAHAVPLVGRAREIIMARMPEGGGYLFAGRSGTPIAQKVLGVEVFACSGKSDAPIYAGRKVCPVSGWSPHDLRRTARTLLSELGCPFEIGEAILAHKLGGIAGAYNKAEHLAGRVEWLTKLGDRLDSLTESRAALALAGGAG